MKKILFVVALIALTITPAKAQTPQHTVAWLYRNETALNVNTNYVQAVSVNGNIITTTALKPTCVQAAADVSCTIPVGTLATDTAHTLSVSATYQNVTAVTNITNFRIGVGGAKNATDFKYQIQINVNLP
jgi:hypothetical protein